jgi:O-antigen/teichoic acid export membrane protein
MTAASAPRRPLASNVVANVANAATTIAASAVALPLILHYVGIDGFGIWTLAQTSLVYVATAETGFGPAVQRYVSVAHGARDARTASRIVWSSSAFYVVLGVLVAVATVLLAPALVDLFNVPAALHADAVTMFRLIGPVMLLALLAAGLGNVLQGVERFVAATAATAASVATFLVVAVILLATGHGLVGLAIAAGAQYAVGVVVRVWLVRDLLAIAPFGRISRHEARGLLSFSARMQVNVLSTLVNSQTDKIIVGLIATTAAVGEVGIGSQVAEALRFIVFAALGPSIARMAVSHGEGDPAVLGRLYHRLKGVWLPATGGAVLVACGAVFPLIAAWLGPGYGKAALYAGLLTVAYGINAMTGPGTAYLRAIGRPGLEARYGALVIVLNLATTVGLGLVFGPIGVVAATTFAYSAGTAWFMLRLRANEPAHERQSVDAEPPSRVRIAAGALLAGAFTLGWGLLALELTPRPVALVLVAAGAGAALLGYFALVMKVRPDLTSLPLARRFAARP